MPRSYSSDIRAERSRQTRAAVIEVAHELFLTDGWVATTMARVAVRSGVARQTVYLLFDSKLALLDACIDRALSDGRAVRVRDLPEYQLMGRGDFDTRAVAAARWLAGAHERSATIQRVLDEAAVTDSDAKTRLLAREEQRWAEVRWAASLVLDTADPDAAVVDALWTLASRDVWLKLVHRGWSSDRWQKWFIAMITATRTAAS